MTAQEVDESQESRVPRNVEVELLDDLVGCCSAGDEVSVLGFVRVLNTDASGGKRRWLLSRLGCQARQPVCA